MGVQSKDQSQLRFKWMLIVAALFLLPLLVGLGFWQLQRAAEKQQLLGSEDQSEPLYYLPSLHDLSPLRYTRFSLTGTLDQEQYFLLDNRTRDGRVGYEVIALFSPLGENVALLVNLGWLPAPALRDQLPEVDLPEMAVELQLAAKQLSEPLLLEQDQWAQGWPKRIQAVNLTKAETELGLPLWGTLARLEQPLLTELDLRWNLNLMSPQRHLGYAVQWFSLALALLLLLLWSAYRLQKEHGLDE